MNTPVNTTVSHYLSLLQAAKPTPEVKNAIILLHRRKDDPELNIDMHLGANAPTFRQVADRALANA